MAAGKAPSAVMLSEATDLQFRSGVAHTFRRSLAGCMRPLEGTGTRHTASTSAAPVSSHAESRRRETREGGLK